MINHRKVVELFLDKKMTKKEIAEKYHAAVVTITGIINNKSENGKYVERQKVNQRLNLQGEIWKKIRLETKTTYYISNKGRVKSLAYNKPKILNGKLVLGYLTIDFTINGQRKNILIHTLVAKYFIGKPPKNSFIIHRDYNKLNNAASNLKYVTSIKEGDRTRKHTLIRTGGIPKLNEASVAKIKIAASNGKRTIEIADQYNISQMTVNRIHRGENWPHVLPHLTRAYKNAV